jgi:DNA repair/transcription protein MET18/MMS19
LKNWPQAVDEEKDPNNLMVIFSCWPIILANFELEPLTDDAFDTLSCYFPIDFTPQSGIFGSVTREDLVQVAISSVPNVYGRIFIQLYPKVNMCRNFKS